MLKEYKYYFISIDLTDGRGKLFRVKVIIDSGSAFNLIHPSLVNRRKLFN